MASTGRLLLSSVLVFFLVSSFQGSATAALGGRPLAGGWSPIKFVGDPTVVAIGRFAVDEHNKEAGSALEFGRVVKGEFQIVAGTNYNLTIEAKKGGLENNYVALVWDKPWEKFRKLLSFNGPI